MPTSTCDPPRWTLMVAHTGRIACIPQAHEADKKTCGWVLVAREADLLPFNQPHWRKDTT